MTQPFLGHYKEIVDGMSIGLYQKFNVEDACLFLRYPQSGLE